MTRAFISAGEASGDLHASTLVRELKARDGGLQFFGLGGELMQEEGVELWYDLNVLAVTGFWEVAKRYFSFRRIFHDVLRKIEEIQPDVAILVDYPGFNLRLARRLHDRGIKVIYYIAPQVWAWKQKRIKAMERNIDLLISILPFEESFFSRTSLRCKFVGHPLLDQVDAGIGADKFRDRYKVAKDERILALLPGSRRNELESHYSIMLNAAHDVASNVEKLRTFVLVRDEIGEGIYKEIERNSSESSPEHVRSERFGLLKAADVAIVKSGTSTVETALCQTPFCVVYRTGWITYQIARRVIKLGNVGMANIIAGKTVVPEFLQYEMTPENLSRFCIDILTSSDRRSLIESELEKLREKLGEPGAAGRAAAAVLEELN